MRCPWPFLNSALRLSAVVAGLLGSLLVGFALWKDQCKSRYLLCFLGPLAATMGTACVFDASRVIYVAKRLLPNFYLYDPQFALPGRFQAVIVLDALCALESVCTE